MKTKIFLFAAVLLSCLTSHAQQTLYPKHGTIWVSWEEDGHQWMVGCIKEYAKATDDPSFVQTDFGKGYVVKVQGEHSTGSGILFHQMIMTNSIGKSLAIGVTNIAIAATYTGTITVGTNLFKVAELLKGK